jgi:tricorn protease
VLLSLVVVIAHPIADGKPFMRFPSIHGDQVCFTSEADLWLGDIKTGEAHRITSDAGTERHGTFSPDGSQIAFEGEYDGQRQAYVMPTNGGTPKKLTSVEQFRAVTGWTPDGKGILVRYLHEPTAYAQGVVSATGGIIRDLPLEFASHVAFGPDNEHYTFTRFVHAYANWFRYIGGLQNQIWIHEPVKGHEFRQITNIEGTNEFPVWCGNRIYFSNEQNAHFSLMSVPAGGGNAKKELDSEFEIRELQSDGKRVIFQNGRDLQLFDPLTSKAMKIELNLNSDLIHARPTTIPAEASVQDASPTPSGKRALVGSRGQIITAPFGEGEARVVKSTPGVRYQHPSMSSDAKKIVYVDDSTGEQQIYVSNADGSSPKQLTKNSEGQIWGPRFSPDGKWIGFSDSHMCIKLVNVETGEIKTVANVSTTWFAIPFEFSPDSKWVSFTQVRPITLLNAIELFEISSGKTHEISDGRANDSLPAFSSDGKYLVFVTNRHIAAVADPILNQMNIGPMGVICIAPLRADGEDPLAPKDTEEGEKKEEEKKVEFKIDQDGLFARRIEIPSPPANITKVAMVGTKIIYATDDSVKVYDITAKTTADAAPGATTFTLAADGKSALVTPGNALIGLAGEPKKVINYGGLRLHVEPVREWTQIYWDGWRHLRDYFYMPNMNGLNWKAIGDKYAAYLPSVRSRDEVDELLRWLQSEIGSSHEYLSPGDGQNIKPRIGGAFLGVELAVDPSGFYRIDKIFKGDGFDTSERSPLIGPGKNITEGMFLLAIGGEQLSTDADPYEKLAGRAGKTISVTVNSKPTMEGSKTYLIKPVASEGRMRYLSWVEANRQYVSQNSGGKLGYLHLAAMSVQDMDDFVRQYMYQRDKQGFVIDGRYNNGGFVQDYIIRILSERLSALWNMRGSKEPWTRQQDYFNGPMALLINEFDISCGEEFPHHFRDAKLGPLIGRRTMGGEVGSDPGWPLIDGGVINVPGYGMYTPDGKWAIEGKGVSPDIDVPSDPNAFIMHRDPQIDRAIEYLLVEIKKRPLVSLTIPPARDRTKNGG